MRTGRLTSEVPAEGEAFHELAALGHTRVEHIVSSNTPDDSLQIGEKDEWVLLLSGWADMEVEGRRVQLRTGEWLLLPAGTPHRVRRVTKGTQWLAVHADPAR